MSTVSSFSELGLPPALVRAVNEVGYETPSPIQAAAIAPLLEGRDILGQAQTGTGKTAAFALPLLSRIALEVQQPQILVLTPTRELAIQVAEAMQTYARFLPGFRVLPVYGGQSLSAQLRPLRRGVHAVVGTPGRVLDHLRRGTLVLTQLAAVVLDEADEMLRMGFIEDVEHILQQTPAGRQLALFSATMPDAIRTIARRHTRDPVEVRIQTATATVPNVSQRYWPVTGMHKLDALTRILEVEDFDAMVVFVRTKGATTELAQRLEARGFSSAAINGDMNQAARESVIESLKKGRLDILVATDVAARGLDVDRITHVINYDIPYDTQAYVHRIGRTARAGRPGAAILFVAPRERRMLHAIERATGERIEKMTIPSREDVADARSARFKARLDEVIGSRDLAPFESLVDGYQAAGGVSLRTLAAALLSMTQGEHPLPAADRSDGTRESATDRPPVSRPDAPARPTGGQQRDRQPADGARQSAVTPVPPQQVRYRIEVGAEHGVQAKNIVGAIANEAGLDSCHIGAVHIEAQHSTVDLPAGMPRDLFRHLKQVWICGRRMNISLVRGPRGTKPDLTARAGGAHNGKRERSKPHRERRRPAR